jgi:hypothetical protein
MTTQWHFVIAAYAVTAVGTIAVVAHSWRAMLRAEGRADGLRDRAAAPDVPADPSGAA